MTIGNLKTDSSELSASDQSCHSCASSSIHIRLMPSRAHWIQVGVKILQVLKRSYRIIFLEHAVWQGSLGPCMTLVAKCTWRCGFNADLDGLRLLSFGLRLVSFAFLTGVLFVFLRFDTALAPTGSRSDSDEDTDALPASKSVPESETLVQWQDKCIIRG